MKRDTRPLKPVRKPSELTQKKLTHYALAAGAAAACALACTPLSEAEVVFTRTDVVLGQNYRHSYDLDLNNDGMPDFVIASISVGTSNHSAGHQSVFITETPPVWDGVQLNFVVADPLNNGAAALYAGAVVCPGRKLGGRQLASVRFGSGGSSFPVGDWINVTNRYLGLRFQINGETHYGWARLTVEYQHGLQTTLTGYAYETIANRPIITGPTEIASNKQPTILPERASLGLLAAGAPGLSARKGK